MVNSQERVWGGELQFSLQSHPCPEPQRSSLSTTSSKWWLETSSAQHTHTGVCWVRLGPKGGLYHEKIFKMWNPRSKNENRTNFSLNIYSDEKQGKLSIHWAKREDSRLAFPSTTARYFSRFTVSLQPFCFGSCRLRSRIRSSEKGICSETISSSLFYEVTSVSKRCNIFSFSIRILQEAYLQRKKHHHFIKSITKVIFTVTVKDHNTDIKSLSLKTTGLSFTWWFGIFCLLFFK